jgi:hypothetical protein
MSNMANVRISPVFNDAQFTSNGDLLSGGKIYTFAANSNSVLQTSYTDSSGKIQNSNPIVLDSSGRLQMSIWLIENLSYRLVLTDSANNTITVNNNVLGLPTPPANLFYKSATFADTVFYDNNGQPLANGKIYSYNNNTFTSKTPTYSDSTGNTTNPNPIVLSNTGTPNTQIFLSNNKKYNLVLTDSNDTTILKNYNDSYGFLSVNVPPPTIDLFTFIPTPVVVGGFPYELDWETSNVVSITYAITANINGNVTPIANGIGGVDGNTTGTALNSYWSMSGNLAAQGAPGASPLTVYATANVLVSTVYTSALYPYVFSEELTVGLPSLEGGYMFSAIQEEVDIGLPSIVSGNLVATINYVTYQDYPPEEVDVGLPTIISGNLVATINYVTYQDYPVEEVDVGLPTIISGNLAVTINYVTYQDYPPEEVDIGLPTIVSGTLI